MFLDGEGGVNFIDNQTVKNTGTWRHFFLFQKTLSPAHFSSDIFIPKKKTIIASGACEFSKCLLTIVINVFYAYLLEFPIQGVYKQSKPFLFKVVYTLFIYWPHWIKNIDFLPFYWLPLWWMTNRVQNLSNQIWTFQKCWNQIIIQSIKRLSAWTPRIS